MTECITNDCQAFSIDTTRNICQLGTLNDTVELAKGQGRKVFVDHDYMPQKGSFSNLSKLCFAY